MLSKVRQLREEMARVQNRLRQITDSATTGNQMGANEIPDGAGYLSMSKEEKLRQQVMLGTESLERTSQSIARYSIIYINRCIVRPG